jgi:hypothetical protein
MSTSTTTAGAYVGCRVRWVTGELIVPAAQCQPHAAVVHERHQTGPDTWELVDGVRIAHGDLGTVTEFIGPDQLGEAYRIQFDSGAEFVISLPQPHAVAVLVDNTPHTP